MTPAQDPDAAPQDEASPYDASQDEARTAGLVDNERLSVFMDERDLPGAASR